MAPSEHDDSTEDLERRLREAFSAKALQISDADLDHDREAEVVAALHGQDRKHPAARWFAGIGSAAAAAAIIGVAFVGLHDSGQQQVIDGLPPALTSSSSAATSSSSSTTTSTQTSSATSWPSASTSGSSTIPSAMSSTQSQSSTATTEPSDSTSGSSESSDSSDQDRTMTSEGSATAAAPSGGTAPSMKLAVRRPPALPGGLPQAGALGDQEYAGAIPLDDPSGGPKRELAMPSGVKWQRTAQSGNSLTVRITDLPTGIEAYWQQTLPGQGWVASGSGWTFPDTGYTVSPITDKGSFTVTW